MPKAALKNQAATLVLPIMNWVFNMDMTDFLLKLDFLIAELEQNCEYPNVNCLMQRLMDAKFDFEEVYPDESL